MKSNLKKGLFTLVIVGAVSFAAVELFSHGWNYGHMGPGNGHMGPGYGQRGPGYNNYSRIDRLKEWLGLSEKQIEKIFKIGSKYRAKLYKNRGNRDKIYSLRKEYQKEFEDVLTKSQKKKYNTRQGNKAGYGGCGW